MNNINQSLKKIFKPVLIYSFVLVLFTFVMTGLKMGLVNLDVRRFWSFEYPRAMPNPENYTYIDEAFNIALVFFSLIVTVGMRRYCIKKLNNESCDKKDVFLFFTKPKSFFCAFLCEYVPSILITWAGSLIASNLFFYPFLFTIKYRLKPFVYALVFVLLGVLVWLVPYIYSVNNTKPVKYAFGNSFSITPKYFWKIFGLITMIIVMDVIAYAFAYFSDDYNIPFNSIISFVLMLAETSASMLLGYNILKNENMIEEADQITVQ